MLGRLTQLCALQQVGHMNCDEAKTTDRGRDENPQKALITIREHCLLVGFRLVQVTCKPSDFVSTQTGLISDGICRML
jgi:hypothetical protein